MRRLAWQDDVELVVAELRSLTATPSTVRETTTAILAEVREQGDAGVRAATARLDGVTLAEEYALPAAPLQRALGSLPDGVRRALELATANLRRYHEREAPASWRERFAQGQVVGQRVVPMRTAGLYVPGGLADYPSSVLMTAVPAQVAGVERLVVCSPPRPDGGVAAGVAAACALLSLDLVLPVGGAQAIAAMAFGTRVVPRCDVIVGPGNAYVTEAKRQVQGAVAIDGLAGPSEVLVIAGPDADPRWLAADLLAQTEHGAGATACLADIGGGLAEPLEAALDELAAELDLSHEAIACVACPDLDAAVALCDAFAPEHLELHLDDASAVVPRVRNAGAVFVGRAAATAFADYVAGSNHVLPTGGAARFSQGLSVAHFQKRMAVVELDEAAAAALAAPVAALAGAEGLRAHARSAELRAEEGRS